MNTYTHEEIRAYMSDEANGTICELPLIAIKNLESAIYKRKSLNEVERKALEMLIQCADEIREHINDKPIDNKVRLPRDLRDGLKREIVDAMRTRNASRFREYAGASIIDDKGFIWSFDENERLYRVV